LNEELILVEGILITGQFRHRVMEVMYFIDTRPRANGSYYIHSEECPLLASPGNRIFLGKFLTPEEAVEEGGKYFNNPVSCRFCMHEDHAKIENVRLAEIHENDDYITHVGIDITWESALFCGVN
jgi:hypothetical protein